MKRNNFIIAFVLITALVAASISLLKETAAQNQRSACDLLSKVDVEKITGFVVTNVVLRDRNIFSSCSYEADNWENTTGVIFYPDLNPPASSAALAEDIRKDLEKDQAPYKIPEPVNGIADAAAYYTDNDEFMHFMVAQNGRERIVVSAKSKAAVTELVKIALGSK